MLKEALEKEAKSEMIKDFKERREIIKSFEKKIEILKQKIKQTEQTLNNLIGSKALKEFKELNLRKSKSKERGFLMQERIKELLEQTNIGPALLWLKETKKGNPYITINKDIDQLKEIGDSKSKLLDGGAVSKIEKLRMFVNNFKDTEKIPADLVEDFKKAQNILETKKGILDDYKKLTFLLNNSDIKEILFKNKKEKKNKDFLQEKNNILEQGGVEVEEPIFLIDNEQGNRFFVDGEEGRQEGGKYVWTESGAVLVEVKEGKEGEERYKVAKTTSNFIFAYRGDKYKNLTSDEAPKKLQEALKEAYLKKKINKQNNKKQLLFIK